MRRNLHFVHCWDLIPNQKMAPISKDHHLKDWHKDINFSSMHSDLCLIRGTLSESVVLMSVIEYKLKY